MHVTRKSGIDCTLPVQASRRLARITAAACGVGRYMRFTTEGFDKP